MKMNKFARNISIWLCSTMLSAATLQAQNQVTIVDEMPNGVVIVTIDKAGDEIIRIMNESQLPYFHDPQAPRFLLMDKKGKFALGIGGYVRATAEYDFGGLVDNIDFVTTDIPSHSKIGNQFQMDASTASIFLKLVGHTDLLGDFIVYTAGNFRGDGKTLKLRNAYITFRNITVGYTYGGFMDVGAVPTTIDYQGPDGAAFYRAMQIAYSYHGWKNVRLNASIEVPEVNGTINNGLEIAQQRMPDFTFSAQYNWSHNSHLRLAGIVRSMTYTNNLSNHPKAITGYGLQLSGNLNLAEKWRFYGQATYGKGIAQYLNDISTLNVDLVPDPEQEGKMQTLPMMGWYAGVQYNLTPKLFVSSTYSMTRLYSRHGYPADEPSFYRYGQYLAANAIWSVTPNMQVGAEYLRGRRSNFDGSGHHANRVNLLVQYSF